MLRLPRFTLVQPRTIGDAVRARADAGPDAMYVAGGTDLWPNMKRRQQTPRTVIALSSIPDLSRVSGSPRDGLTIGAGVSLAALAAHADVLRHYPAVAHAAEQVSTPTLRHMGTIGGNLLLDTRCNYYDQTEEWRRAIDYCMKKDGTICWVATSSPRCWAVQSSDGVPVAVALGAEASHPQEVPEAAAALVGAPLSDATITAAADAAYKPAKPMDNTDFTLAWRKEMVRVHVKRALAQLATG